MNDTTQTTGDSRYRLMQDWLRMAARHWVDLEGVDAWADHKDFLDAAASALGEALEAANYREQ